MKFRVCCTGESFDSNPRDSVELVECDWTGYRRPGEIQVGPDAYDTRLFPCPRCGSRVELIASRVSNS
jgi:hypothetical protein